MTTETAEDFLLGSLRFCVRHGGVLLSMDSAASHGDATNHKEISLEDSESMDSSPQFPWFGAVLHLLCGDLSRNGTKRTCRNVARFLYGPRKAESNLRETSTAAAVFSALRQ